MSQDRLLICGGHLVDPKQQIDAQMDLLIRDGKIVEIKKGLKPNGARLIDAKGKIVAPGFIDMHVHLRTPGQEHKETIATGARAAIKGGFTTVCAMANTDPVVDSAPLVEYIKTESARIGLVHVLQYGAVTVGLKGETLTEMGSLQRAGVIGFSDDGMPVSNAGVMRRALEYSRMTGLPVVSHCEEKSLDSNGVMHEGLTAIKLGLAGIPSESETVMMARDLLLAEATGGKIHIAHVSTREGVELIRQAKKKGISVSAEVTPHHLTLTEEALNTYDARFKMNPPLRAQEDSDALRQGLKDGTIDVIATDHAPHAVSEKESDLSHAPFGVVGLETALAVLLTELVHSRTVELSTIIAALTQRPAEILGIQSGTLAVGSAADVVLIDLSASWTVEAASFASKGINSPFLGWHLNGQVTDVLVDGKEVFRNKQFVNNGVSA